MQPQKTDFKKWIGLIRWIDRVTDWMIQIALIIVMAFGVYSLWDSRVVYSEADAANYTAYKPSEEDSISFEELRKINAEVFGWLTVNDTPIDYPLTQADNNEKYINTNAEGRYTLSGSIFLDYRNSPDFDDFNSIIYGHHMEKRKMFGALSDFADASYFETHKYGNLYFDGKDHGLEFFALILTDAYDDRLFTPAVKGEERSTDLLTRIREKARHFREIPVTADDRIVLLSTCTNSITNGRYMLVGRITDELLPQKTQVQQPVIQTGEGIDGQMNRLTEAPVWLWVFLLLIFIALDRLFSQKKRNRKGRNRC